MWSDNENEPLPDPHGEDYDGANRSANSQVDSQLEYREIESDANNCESPQIKSEVVISNRSIFEITEMLNDVDDDTKNVSADPLAASVSNHAEVIVPNESGSASVMNIFDAPTTSTQTVMAIRTANVVQKKGIIENGSGSFVIDDVPTTSQVLSQHKSISMRMC